MSCTGQLYQEYGSGLIYPDYMDVTIPSDIAPLNFDYTVPARNNVTVFSFGDLQFSFKGSEVRWNARKWHRLLSVAKGGDITVTSSAPDTSWIIHVSEDDIDYGVAYRLLEPGYEVYSKMGIYERELSSFRQRAVVENTEFSGCVNCHAFNRGNTSSMSLHIRGDHGATVLMTPEKMEAFNTKTDTTKGFCVYPYWHPGGRFIAYSTNNTRQIYHSKPEKLLEVFDLSSDVLIYDVEANELVLSPSVMKHGMWETFPVFSADGKSVYFCAAEEKELPYGLEEVRYNLYKAPFDEHTGAIGDSLEVIIDAVSMGKSVSFPRPSYDGRFLVYTLSDYGQFSIWHHEADLWLLDIVTGKSRRLEGTFSPDTESFHNWSSNSRWLVFSSRRDDGQFTRLYFSHIDENGNASKAFMLPQKNPTKYYGTLFMSYNVPDFITAPLSVDNVKASKLINAEKRIPFGVKFIENKYYKK
ncbi:MAG: PD40 domain-containing protein [Alistipes sp.]|nr:PD40 domain-containing protein [Candidatus Minthomonas equi]